MPSKPPRIFDRSFGYGEVSNAHDDLMFATALRLLDKSIRWIARSLRIEQVSLLVRTEISMSWRAPQPRVGSVGERPSVWISQPGTEGRRRTAFSGRPPRAPEHCLCGGLRP